MLNLKLVLPVQPPLQSLPNKLIQQHKKTRKITMVGQYYDRSQPCECCSSLSFRGRNRKCWIWNYFRCSHCRVYRINWYNNAKKISWNYNCWPILWSIPNSAASEAGTGNAESEILTSSAAARPLQTLPNKLIQQQRSCRIIGTFYIPKRKKLVKSPQGRNSSQDFNEKN